ncbi:MAG TPA: DNA polymerase III subunit delta' [Nitrospiria bacterium]|nr:DNA polymerase III subunit delta' [Nitrospiria bacterium]
MISTAIIGHERPKKILCAALAQKEVAHAYLFHGEASIGKFTTAKAFAKTIQCEKQGDACGECRACKAIESGIHPDVQIIQPDGPQIKIDQVRILQEALVFKPLIGNRKIIIVDEAESMNPEAANCFLKTLEEPPDHSLLILVASQPHRLLPTILSRCQRIRFDPPKREDIAGWLIRQKGLSQPEAELLAALSLGRIGLALTNDLGQLLDQRDKAVSLLSPDALSNLDQLFENSRTYAGDEETFRATLDWILIWLRDLLVYRHNPDPRLLINLDRREELSQHSKHFSTDLLLKIMALLAAFHRAAHRNLNRTLVLETVLLELRDNL